jgi:S1-C subfamily serine protease
MRVRIKGGPRDGEVVEIAERLTVGRDESAGLTLADDAEVSREHAYFSPLPDGRLEVGDLESRNGTFVNQNRLTGPVSLSGGEEIRLGNTTLVAEADPPGAGAAVAAGAPAAGAPSGPPEQPPPPPPGEPQPPHRPPEQPPRRPPEQPPRRPPEQPPRRGQSRIGRMSQSAIQRFKLQRSVRILTIVGAVAIVLSLATVILLVTGTFSGGPPSGAEVVEEVRPSTLRVATYAEGEAVGSGTGWVYDLDQGLVVTNAHVVTLPAEVSIEAAQAGGAVGTLTYTIQPETGEERDATLVGNAPCADLALLRVDDTSGLSELPVADSEVTEGETVYVAGYPGNEFAAALEEPFQATKGIASAVGTSVSEDTELGKDPDIRVYPDLVQTDAAINHGNSGGPMVNEDVELVGVNTLGTLETQSQFFAIGLGHTRGLVDRMAAEEGTGFLGFDFLATGNSLYVASATEGTEAAKLGFGSEGVEIDSVNGEPVPDRKSYCSAIEDVPAGEAVTVEGLAESGPFSEQLPIEAG